MSANLTHIIILPYRDRLDELTEFNTIMPPVFNHDICDRQSGSWEIWYIQQNDKKPFNRGALLNIGAREVITRYGHLDNHHYHNITLIFHDVDITITNPAVIQYECAVGSVRHQYGEVDVNKGPLLGCFCIIHVGDFISSGGFPNYYGWGVEDLTFGYRCLAHKINIDESGIIPRYSHPDIIDKPSHTTPDKLTYIRACHTRNIAKLRGENPNNPTDTYLSPKYRILSTTTYTENIKLFDVDFSL